MASILLQARDLAIELNKARGARKLKVGSSVVEAHLAGQFPRSEQLVGATRAAVRGKISPSDLEEAFRIDLAALVRLQSETDLEYFVDGQLNWQDLFRPFSVLFTGIRPGALARWFDNNTFYRKPIVVGKVGSSNLDLNYYFRSNLLPASGSKKAILPGPFTFALMSESSSYASFADLVDDIAHGLRKVVGGLQKVGYRYFQFDEPSLCAGNRTENELEMAKHAFEVCAKGISAKTAVQTYFGNAGPVIDALMDYPVDCVGLDFYATSIDALREHSFTKELGCGCIDARNSLLESLEGMLEFLITVREALEPKRLSICPNSDLAFLPYPIAEKKVHLLSDIKKKMET